MAYSVSADLQQAVGGADRLVQIADWDGDGVADASVIASAIAGADAEIDTYAVKLFTTPFNPVPTAIREISARIARFKIADARGVATEAWQTQYAKDLEWLDALAKGQVAPGPDPFPAKSSVVVDKVVTRPSTKEIGREALKGFS